MSAEAKQDQAEYIARLFGSLTLASSHVEASIDLVAMRCNDLNVSWPSNVAKQFPLNMNAKSDFISRASKLEPLNQIENATYFSSSDFSIDFTDFSKTRNWITHGRIVSFANTESGVEFVMSRFFPPKSTERKGSGRSVPWKLRRVTEEQIVKAVTFAHKARIECDALEKGLWRFCKAWPTVLHADAQVVIDPVKAAKTREPGALGLKQESKQS